eukprot:3632700-Rhodomonas_salina.1
MSLKVLRRSLSRFNGSTVAGSESLRVRPSRCLTHGRHNGGQLDVINHHHHGMRSRAGPLSGRDFKKTSPSTTVPWPQARSSYRDQSYQPFN